MQHLRELSKQAGSKLRNAEGQRGGQEEDGEEDPTISGRLDEEVVRSLWLARLEHASIKVRVCSWRCSAVYCSWGCSGMSAVE